MIAIKQAFDQAGITNFYPVRTFYSINSGLMTIFLPQPAKTRVKAWLLRELNSKDQPSKRPE